MAEPLTEPTVLTLRVETTNPHAYAKMHALALYLNDQVGIDRDNDGRCHDAQIELMHDDLLWYTSVFDGAENNPGPDGEPLHPAPATRTSWL